MVQIPLAIPQDPPLWFGGEGGRRRALGGELMKDGGVQI